MTTIIPKMDLLPGIWGFKDVNLAYKEVNKECSIAMGLKHPNDVIGLTDYDMPENVVLFADRFQNQDRQIMRENKRLDLIEMNRYADGWHIYWGYKVPTVDQNNQVNGIYFRAVDVMNTPLIVQLHLFLRKGYLNDENKYTAQANSSIISSSSNNVELTTREHEIVYCLMHGNYTSKQLAIIFKITPRTVDAFINQLCLKFSASTRNEMIDKAFEHGFSYKIPSSFLEPLSIYLNDSVKS